jgi:putative chitinase
MSTDWKKVLLAVCPHGNKAILSGMCDTMPAIITIADLNTPLRLAHFLSQCAEESAGFTAWHEFASGWAYEGRRDLGNVQRGDGPRYRGAGDIETTGRANYARLGKVLGIDLVNHPELLQQFPAWGLSGAVYWRDHHINNHADADDCNACTKAVNGGYNGLSARRSYLMKFKKALGVK